MQRGKATYEIPYLPALKAGPATMRSGSYLLMRVIIISMAV